MALFPGGPGPELNMFPSYFTVVEKSDAIFLGFLVICGILLAGITFTMLYFVIRYSRRRNPVASQNGSHTLLEITWTVVPTILVLGMFYYGWIGFREMRTAPPGAMKVKVTARMWSWLFEYENGIKSDKLFVPLKEPVVLLMTSQDVLHSFFVPAFRIKEDMVPGMETHLWFQPEREGRYDVFCAEFCGVGHSSMLTEVVVMQRNEFEEWYRGGEEEKGEPTGEELVKNKGCTACHSLDGTRIVGPSFKGIWGRKIVVVSAGKERSIVVDEDYLRNSLLDPGADLVKGYPPVMPPQGGNLTDQEIHEIIEYLKTL